MVCETTGGMDRWWVSTSDGAADATLGALRCLSGCLCSATLFAMIARGCVDCSVDVQLSMQDEWSTCT